MREEEGEGVGFSVRAEEAKKTQQTLSKSTESVKTSKKVWNSIEDIKSEFSRITWTSREELQVYTKIVVSATFFLGLAVYLVDLTIQSMLTLTSVVVRALIG